MLKGVVMRSTQLLATFVLVITCGLGGCKKKREVYIAPPPPDLPATAYDLADICSGAKKSFTSVQPYTKHADGSPSKVVVFAKSLDEKSVGWAKQSLPSIDGWSAEYRLKEAELTACVEAKPAQEAGFTCSYYGASVQLHSRDYTLRIVETATGKVLVNEDFTGDARTFTCPATVNGSKNWWVSFDRRLYGELFALQPASTTPMKERPNALYAVCSGTPVTSAGKPGTPGAAKVVYFNDASSSFSNVMPSGIEDVADEGDVASYTTVVCVTAKHEKKLQSCDFYDKTLDLYAGSFDVVVREARTAKVIATKSFKGSSGYCPSSYTFDGARSKKWMTSIDPSFKPWLATLFGSSI